MLPEVQDLDHVGVPDLRSERCLVQKHLLELIVLAELRQHGLYGNNLLEAARPGHARRPHHGHAAGCHGEQELVAAQHVARTEPGDGQAEESAAVKTMAPQWPEPDGTPRTV